MPNRLGKGRTVFDIVADVKYLSMSDTGILGKKEIRVLPTGDPTQTYHHFFSIVADVGCLKGRTLAVCTFAK